MLANPSCAATNQGRHGGLAQSVRALIRTAGHQVWDLRRVIAIVWTPALLAIGLVLLARLRWGIPVLELTGDPVVVMQAPWYVGAFSYLGVLAWCATAAIALVLAQLVGVGDAWVSGYLRGAGALSLLLCLDDLFLFHEEIFPKHLGLPQAAVVAVYGGFTLWLLWRHRRVLLAGEFVLLAIALGMFALSLAVDQLATGPRHFYLLEDGAKFLGVVMWLTFHTRLGMQALRRSSGQPAGG